MKTSFAINFVKTSRLEGVEPIKVNVLAVDIDCASIAIDGMELPEASIQYLIGYGIKQTLADSYAQLVDADKISAAFASKLANIIEGAYEFDGENGNRGDPVRGEMRKLAEAAILAGKSRTAWVKVNGENAEKLLTAKVNKVMEANADKLRARAEAIVAQRKLELDLDLGEDPLGIHTVSEPVSVLIKGKGKKAA